MKSVNEIVSEIVERAQAVNNPDPVSCLQAVSMEVDRGIMDVMAELREKERRIRRGETGQCVN
jgi:hypothetical protein